MVTEPFTAFRIHRDDGRITAALEQLKIDDLTPGDVVVAVGYSSINYKDALAATGRGSILRRFPLVGGIDLAGEIVESSDPDWPAGTPVIVCGAGLSETRDGGFAEYARVASDALVLMPRGLDARSAMAIGTAGFTAALAIDRLEHNGQRPDLGPVAVTGASGGVGSMAVDMLASRGYEVMAVTGKREAADYLRALGASAIVERTELATSTKPLESARFGGAIDSLGGEALATLLKSTRPHGNVASIGLAASPELNTTVLPFILRGVNLLGINSVDLSQAVRQTLWDRLAGDLKPKQLARIASREISLDDLPTHFADYIDARVTGRTIVAIGARDRYAPG